MVTLASQLVPSVATKLSTAASGSPGSSSFGPHPVSTHRLPANRQPSANADSILNRFIFYLLIVASGAAPRASGHRLFPRTIVPAPPPDCNTPVTFIKPRRTNGGHFVTNVQKIRTNDKIYAVRHRKTPFRRTLADFKQAGAFRSCAHAFIILRLTPHARRLSRKRGLSDFAPFRRTPKSFAQARIFRSCAHAFIIFCTRAFVFLQEKRIALCKAPLSSKYIREASLTWPASLLIDSVF